jgi:hypothetical protein
MVFFALIWITSLNLYDYRLLFIWFGYFFFMIIDFLHHLADKNVIGEKLELIFWMFGTLKCMQPILKFWLNRKLYGFGWLIIWKLENFICWRLWISNRSANFVGFDCLKWQLTDKFCGFWFNWSVISADWQS